MIAVMMQAPPIESLIASINKFKSSIVPLCSLSLDVRLRRILIMHSLRLCYHARAHFVRTRVTKRGNSSTLFE